jgi:cytochrome c peroxidase
MVRTSLLVVLLVLTASGCRPAGRFYPETTPTPETTAARVTTIPVSPLMMWMPPQIEPSPGLPLVFVAEDTDPSGWQSLPDRPLLERPTHFLFGWPAAKIPGRVLVKVPRGLPDPSPLVPSANPMTRGKWNLGRQLFYDSTWLTATGNISCATCHQPERLFTDGKVHEGLRTPSLINVVYNKRQFSDGRVGSLEEVVQQSLQDEQLPENERFRHAWGGVVTRLGHNGNFLSEFGIVFGSHPTQDAVGKALATYLRTLLVGDSVHDRAEANRRTRGAADLAAGDYKTFLDKEFLNGLGMAEGARVEVADRLVQGHQLFQTLCVRCHSGPLYTDHGFHNLGVGPPESPDDGTGLGRFATLAVGLKDPALIGAYATPSLRCLPHTGPYLHTGQLATIEQAVDFHSHGGRISNYLDPAYRLQWLGHDTIPAKQQADLVLFLRALDGKVNQDLLQPSR